MELKLTYMGLTLNYMGLKLTYMGLKLSHMGLKLTYSHGQELFYKFVSNFTNKLVKQLLSMTVFQIGNF